MDASTNSCATRSSRSTIGAERNAAGRVAPNGAELLRELDRLRAVLASGAAGEDLSDCGSAERLLVVSCLAPGLSMEHWRALLRREREAGGPGIAARWFALEIETARYPQLAAAFGRKGAAPVLCPETGILTAEFFMQTLEAELTKCRNSGNELTLIVLEAVDAPERSAEGSPVQRRNALSLNRILAGEAAFAEPESGGAPERRDEPGPLPADPGLSARMPSLLASALRTHARGCDVPARLSEERLGLLMPGAGALRARAFAERLIGVFTETLHRHSAGRPAASTLRAGIAYHDPQAPEGAQELMEQALKALDAAQPGGTRTFRKAGGAVVERRTQVQACEKQFLFFGSESAR